MLRWPPIPGVGQAPVVHASRIFGFAKVVTVFGFSQPPALACPFARLSALCFEAETLVMHVSVVGKESALTMPTGPVHWGIHGEIHR